MASRGGVAEWTIAAVLKTAVARATVGSNPTPSASEARLPATATSPWHSRPTRVRRILATIGITILAMGMAVTVSWSAIGIRGEGFGLDPDSLIRPSRLAIYGIQFVLVGVIGYGVTRWRLAGESLSRVALVMAAAWIGQGLVLTAVGEPIVANEIDPSNAWYFWLVATAGPLQPLVALLGGLPALRRPRIASTQL